MADLVTKPRIKIVATITMPSGVEKEFTMVRDLSTDNYSEYVNLLSQAGAFAQNLWSDFTRLYREWKQKRVNDV